MIHRWQLLSALTGLLVPAVSAAPHMGAQTRGRVSLGVQTAYNFSDLNESALGGHVLVALPAGFAVYGGVQSYFVSPGNLWRTSATLQWAPRASTLAPYFGVGPYWSRSSAPGVASQTDVGLVGQLGAEARLRTLQPFVELQLLKDGAVSAEAVAGFRIVLAGRR